MEIFKCFEFNTEMFLTIDDLFILLAESNPDTNIGFDSMFIPSAFLDIDGNMKRGELIKTFEDRFSSEVELSSKMVFFETVSKFLTFNDDNENLKG